MEIKKSHTADLERMKPTGFLLGLVVAIALLFCFLEYSSRPDTDEIDDDLLEMFETDMEKIPVVEKNDILAAPEPMAAMESVTANIQENPQSVSAEDIDKLDIDADGKDAANASVLPGPPEKVEHHTSALPPIPLDKDDNVLNWRVVEDLPEYPGGMVEFMKWLTKNLKYPATARSQKIQGKVVVQFVVNKDGTVTDPKIVKSVDPSLDREALRVVGMLPKWKPGKHNGEVCRTLFVIPIVFKL